MSDDTYTGKVSAWAFGGAGILRREGLAVFLPFTIPGETVSYKIINKKKNFAQGEILNILEPSQERNAPPCRLYGECGGCSLQHASYREQLNYKRRIVIDAMERIGKFSDIVVDPVVPAGEQWSYRRHITLHIREGKVGFLGLDNRSLIELRTCALF